MESDEKGVATPLQEAILREHPGLATGEERDPPSSIDPPNLTSQDRRTPTLRSLCLGVLGNTFEDFLRELSRFVISSDANINFIPSDVKLIMVALAKRRQLLDDEVLRLFVNDYWRTLDISCSNVSDFGLGEVAKVCKYIEALDISQCRNITAAGVKRLLMSCRFLKTLRCGGCEISNDNACDCLTIINKILMERESNEEENSCGSDKSWEERDLEDILCGLYQLSLVWPSIDCDSEWLTRKCPKICVNPQPLPDGFRWFPVEAVADTALDEYLLVEHVSGLMPTSRSKE